MNRISGFATLVVASVLAVSVLAKEPTTQGEVSYVTGGAGSDERDHLDASSQRFNLKLTHAAPNGDFVSNVQVRIKDAQGQVMLDTVTEGPLLYAKLPPGSYAVSCTFNGAQQDRSVKVGAEQTQLAFTWPAK